MFTKAKYGWFDSIRIPFRIAPLPVLALVAVAVVSAVVPTTVLALATANFVDTAISVFENRADISATYLPLIFLIVIIGISGILDSFTALLTSRVTFALERKLKPEVLALRAALTYEYIEDSESWELIERISDGLVRTFQRSLAALQVMIRNIGAVIAISGLIVTQLWWAALVLLALSVPLFWVAIYAGRRNYEAEVEAYEYELRYSYFSEEVLTNREPVEERTLFGYAPEITQRYLDNFNIAHREQLAVEMKTWLWQKSASVVMALVVGFIVLLLINPLLTGAMSPGLFTGIAAALFSLVEMLGSSMQGAVEKFTRAAQYLEDFSEFLAFEKIEGATDIPDRTPEQFEGLSFRNVRFRYPTGETTALNDLTFDIVPGKHYAFVGANGAGKTTVAKLLTGLYAGYEGEILLNGRELRSYSASALKTIFAAVNQDFARYEISLADNIALGAAAHDVSEAQIEKVLNDVGLTELTKELPAGLETPLGRLHDESADLSGGQWQRVAIARALLSPAPVKILDEPTAALDPIAESRTYQEFERIMQGKTTILISHRLGSTKLADKIFVFDHGGIIEQGTHNELLAFGGVYAEMLQQQSSWYL